MKQSAGIIVYRSNNDKLEFLLAHPGGPFWSKRDEWSIIKGESLNNELPEETAKREFLEETGVVLDQKLEYFGEFKTKDKQVKVFALEFDLDETMLKSNTCTIEFPPKSGKFIEIPENDKYQWFDQDSVLNKCFNSQKEILTSFINREPEPQISDFF